MTEYTFNKADFMRTYHYQNFDIPSAIVYYIAKNPSTPTAYKKISKCCKYFILKNPVFVITKLTHFKKKFWHLRQNVLDNVPIVTVNSKISYKIWVVDTIDMIFRGPDNRISSIIPKFYRCDAKKLCFVRQIFTLNEFIFLASSVEYIHFIDVSILHENKTVVEFEKLVEITPKVKVFSFGSKDMLNITSKSFKKLLKLPHFTKVEYFRLYRVPETFDIEAFYIYMKKNKNTKFWLTFRDNLSEQYKNRLKFIANEIIKSTTFDFLPPLIYFTGYDHVEQVGYHRIFKNYGYSY